MSFLLLGRSLVRRSFRNNWWTGEKRICKKKSDSCDIQAIDMRPGENHDTKNARLHRPLSPHLTVYRPQVTSMLSIMHRISGMIISTYLFSFAVVSTCLTDEKNFDYYLKKFEQMEFNKYLVLGSKLLLVGPIAYHTCNGVRHLAWDTGSFFSMPALYATGAVMLLCTSLLIAGALYGGTDWERFKKEAEQAVKKK